jgi:hypothetical protein
LLKFRRGLILIELKRYCSALGMLSIETSTRVSWISVKNRKRNYGQAGRDGTSPALGVGGHPILAFPKAEIPVTMSGFLSSDPP